MIEEGTILKRVVLVDVEVRDKGLLVIIEEKELAVGKPVVS